MTSHKSSCRTLHCGFFSERIKIDITKKNSLVWEGGKYWVHVPPSMVSAVKYQVGRQNCQSRNILFELFKLSITLTELVKGLDVFFVFF